MYQAASHKPAFDEIKIRFAIGKQTFYESRAPSSMNALRKSYGVQGLQSCSIGHEGSFKSMFSGEQCGRQVHGMTQVLCRSAEPVSRGGSKSRPKTSTYLLV